MLYYIPDNIIYTSMFMISESCIAGWLSRITIYQASHFTVLLYFIHKSELCSTQIKPETAIYVCSCHFVHHFQPESLFFKFML
jgi:hypothetical protein